MISSDLGQPIGPEVTDWKGAGNRGHVLVQNRPTESSLLAKSRRLEVIMTVTTDVFDAAS
jgi:hypothetical protein